MLELIFLKKRWEGRINDLGYATLFGESTGDVNI
jgi:hypothetical protein